MAKVLGGTKQTQSFVKDAQLRNDSAENMLRNTIAHEWSFHQQCRTCGSSILVSRKGDATANYASYLGTGTASAEIA